MIFDIYGKEYVEIVMKDFKGSERFHIAFSELLKRALGQYVYEIAEKCNNGLEDCKIILSTRLLTNLTPIVG